MKLTLTLLGGTLAAGALFLVACGGGASTPAAPTTAPKTEAKTEAKAAAPAAAPTTAAPAAASPAAASPAAAAKAAAKPSGEPIKMGIVCDRSGPTAQTTSVLCDGLISWLDYTNDVEGGIKGRPVQLTEVDAKYEVPLAVDAYKKMTSRDGIKLMIPFGTPFIDALAPSSKDDKTVFWSPGFGLSNAANGKEFPYIFVGIATYHNQALAAMQYIADDWKAKGKTGNPKVVYIYYDNPAGLDPLNLIKNNKLGLDILDTVPVPATSVDMTTIMTVVKDKNPDYTIDHLFGRTPSQALQAAEKVGFPREKMIGLVWALDEDFVNIVGPGAEGALGVQFAAHPNDNPEALLLVEKYWKDFNKTPNPKARGVLHFNRGLLMGNFLTESARRADNPADGDSLKKGIETFQDFTARGLLAGTTLTSEDHGGTRKVRMYQVKGGKMVQVRDWFEGPLP